MLFILNYLLKKMGAIWLGAIGSLLATVIVLGLGKLRSFHNRKIKILEITEKNIPDEDAVFITIADTSYIEAPVYYGETPQTGPFYKGCLLQLYIENRNSRDISIANFQMIVDKIQPYEKDEFRVVGDLNENGVFLLFAVNNGYTDLDNITLNLNGAFGRKYEPSELSAVLSCDINDLKININHLESGCIKRIGAFHINISELSRLSGDGNWLTLNTSVKFGSMGKENADYFIASLVLDEEMGLYTVYYEGTGNANKEYHAVIDTSKTLPIVVDLPNEFILESNSSERIQVLTSIDRTCTIQYHFEIKAAGKRKIISKIRTVSIWVPVYMTDGGNFDSVREWLLKNDVFEYKYNTKPLLQRMIEFKYNLD